MSGFQARGAYSGVVSMLIVYQAIRMDNKLGRDEENFRD